MEDQIPSIVEQYMENISGKGSKRERIMRRVQGEERGLIPEISYTDIRDPVFRDQEERHDKFGLKAQTFASVLGICLRSRRFLVSGRGTMGWALLSAGRDQGISDICVYEGCKIPFVVEKVSEEKCCFLSQCYLHGFMDGQLWNMACADWHMITLVSKLRSG